MEQIAHELIKIVYQRQSQPQFNCLVFFGPIFFFSLSSFMLSNKRIMASGDRTRCHRRHDSFSSYRNWAEDRAEGEREKKRHRDSEKDDRSSDEVHFLRDVPHRHRAHIIVRTRASTRITIYMNIIFIYILICFAYVYAYEVPTLFPHIFTHIHWKLLDHYLFGARAHCASISNE